MQTSARFRGAVFDVDGVLVDSPHERAWREGLRQLMENEWADVRGRTSYAPEKFTPDVYQRVMSGKPRYAGARAVLEHFGVPDPEERAREYGDRKQVMIVELIEATGRDPGGPSQPQLGEVGAGSQPQPAPRERRIFYNTWHYYQATGDFGFLLDYGAEMMLEVARFWASIARFNPERDRYEIHGVMGPDEFHEKYPGSDEEGLRNNAYTNVMVAWISQAVRETLDQLPKGRRESLRAALGLTDEEVEKWGEMSRRMFVPFHGDGIISQFEGYEDLEELDRDRYREKYGNIQRLDRILKAEGDDPDRYKLAKQADTVLLFFLLPGTSSNGSSSGSATPTTPRWCARTRPTTIAGPPTAPP